MTEVNFQQRFAGLIIDLLVAYVPAFALNLLASITHIHFVAILGYCIMIVLFLLRDAIFYEQSIGKRIMQYRVVRQDGPSMTNDYKRSVLRNLSLFIPFVDIFRFLRHQPRLGDIWAGTRLLQMNQFELF
jgi:uncharacterized RDD family membrane protein YckC